jgi:hypothetical protein
MAKEKGWSKQKVLASFSVAVIVLIVLAAYGVYAMPSTLNTNGDLQSQMPTP